VCRVFYNQSEALFRRAIEIRLALLGEDHLDVAVDKAALAAIPDGLGRYDEWESLYYCVLEILGRQVGIENHEIAINLNNLAVVYAAQGKLETAEQTYCRSLRHIPACSPVAPTVKSCSANSPARQQTKKLSDHDSFRFSFPPEQMSAIKGSSD
jgi:tetratricopeptide (TPR) repeat protein